MLHTSAAATIVVLLCTLCTWCLSMKTTGTKTIETSLGFTVTGKDKTTPDYFMKGSHPFIHQMEITTFFWTDHCFFKKKWKWRKNEGTKHFRTRLPWEDLQVCSEKAWLVTSESYSTHLQSMLEKDSVLLISRCIWNSRMGSVFILTFCGQKNNAVEQRISALQMCLRRCLYVRPQTIKYKSLFLTGKVFYFFYFCYMCFLTLWKAVFTILIW